MKNKIIFSQGYIPILVAFSISLFSLIFICDTLATIIFFITLFIAFSYRNVSSRHIFENTQNVLSPIDGTIVAIDIVDGKLKIHAKVTLCNAPSVLAPVSGEYKIKKYTHGLNLNPNSYKASLLNEQIVYKFHHLRLKLISGICNADIVYTPNSDVSQGDNIGLFLQGNAIITMKNDHKILVKIGDKLTAGQSILFKV